MDYKKRKANFTILLVSLIITLLFAGKIQAEIKLPAVLADHMVLQQQKPIHIWGLAIPAEEITVNLADQIRKTRADKAGHWQATLDPLAAGGPHTLTVTGSKSETLTLEDILVGEVWLCSGQSNMEWIMANTHSPSPEILRADHEKIRLFKVPRLASPFPEADVEAEWQVCKPESVRSFSAVAYYFGRELQQTLDVPVGLINSSWGGTRIEPWTPVAGLESIPSLKQKLEEINTARSEYMVELKNALPGLKEWLKQAGKSVQKGREPAAAPPSLPRHPLTYPQVPTSLYNGMIHPLLPFTIRGAIWYQGEANRNDGLAYTDMMKALINGWRKVWEDERLPFYFVQLAPFNYGYNPRKEENAMPHYQRLPLIWEAQAKVLKTANTGMAVITDISNLYDIHPRNKIEVGRRLSLWALAKTYGKRNLVYSGPLYNSHTIDGKRIRLRFDHVGSGLMSMNQQPLSWFEIAGQNRQFYKAEAEIDGNTVVVWCDKVSNPLAVRFGWHQLATPNLANLEGLPASPFRTDTWDY